MNAGDDVGQSVAFVGDVDGDGLMDLLVGAPGHGNYAGAAYIVHGPLNGSHSITTTGEILVGITPGWTAGTVVGSAGDMNGDGLDDIYVGSILDGTGDQNAGALYLVLSPIQGPFGLVNSDAVIYGEQPHSYAVNSVSGGGDLNDDGTPDILIGSAGFGISSEGAVHGFFGPLSGDLPLSQADFSILGSGSIRDVGEDVEFLDDLHGDGIVDLAIAAGYTDVSVTDSGATLVISGPVDGVLLVDEQNDIYLCDEPGHAVNQVSDAGEVFGNGSRVLLVGSCYDLNTGYSTGTTFLTLVPLTGQQSLQDAKARIHGESVGDQACIVAGGVDLNSDGFDDVVIGAPRESSVGINNGAVYILYGGPGW